jgi:hypothetical protein
METTQMLQRIKSFLVVATTAGVSRLKKKTRGGVENIVFPSFPSLSLNFSRAPALKVFIMKHPNRLVEAKTSDFFQREF